MTQAELAHRLERDQGTVSQWENGKRLPSLDDVISLASVLEMSASQLLPPSSPSRPPATVLLRSYFEESVDIAAVPESLGRFVDELERLDPLSAVIMVTATRPLAAAQQLLAQAQLHGLNACPFDIERAANLCGVHVLPPQPFPEELSGVLVHQGDLSAIGVGKDQNLGRRRFATAHELGHHLLRHHGDFHLDLANAEVGTGPNFDYQLERAANDFAANVLMPATHVSKRYAEEPSIRRLAEEFEVNPIAMTYRLQALGLTPAD